MVRVDDGGLCLPACVSDSPLLRAHHDERLLCAAIFHPEWALAPAFSCSYCQCGHKHALFSHGVESHEGLRCARPLAGPFSPSAPAFVITLRSAAGSASRSIRSIWLGSGSCPVITLLCTFAEMIRIYTHNCTQYHVLKYAY